MLGRAQLRFQPLFFRHQRRVGVRLWHANFDFNDLIDNSVNNALNDALNLDHHRLHGRVVQRVPRQSHHFVWTRRRPRLGTAQRQVLVYGFAGSQAVV